MSMLLSTLVIVGAFFTGGEFHVTKPFYTRALAKYNYFYLRLVFFFGNAQMRTKSLLTCLLLNTVALAQSLSAKDVWVGEENTLQEIVTWWRRMAVMKPLPNCQKVLNKPFDGKQFHHLFANMSVRYYAEICTSPEEGQSYQHRGKLKNGLPEGGVKLFKLPQKQVSYENDGGHHICYHFSPFMGKPALLSFLYYNLRLSYFLRRINWKWMSCT